MGMFDIDAWYLVIFKDRDGCVYSVTENATSVENVIAKVNHKVVEYNLKIFPIGILAVYYCGKIQPIKEVIDGKT